MSVSVIIPAYNEERYIGKCIESLLNQKVPPGEIIVVNNNSSDQTVAIVSRYKKVTLIHEPVQGMIPARNAGLNFATGDILARCDADSQLPLHWIETIEENFKKRPDIDGMSGPTTFYDIAFSGLISPVLNSLYFLTTKLTMHHEFLYGPNMAFTKRIWDVVKNEVCLDSHKVHEDADLSLHIAAHGGTIVYNPAFTCGISARRIKSHPFSIFVEYPFRLIQTLVFYPHKFINE